MIKQLRFSNFKVLRDAVLDLGPFTLIVGPNGSGKSTALISLHYLHNPRNVAFAQVASAGIKSGSVVRLVATLSDDEILDRDETLTVEWREEKNGMGMSSFASEGALPKGQANRFMEKLQKVVVYRLDSQKISVPTQLKPGIDLSSEGASLSVVLDQLRDLEPERQESLEGRICELLPEFDRILFETPSSGVRGFALRTREGKYRIPAHDLSQGTLFLVAILAIAHLPSPPPIVAFEEPDRGLHPRLLRELRDDLYRLAYPKEYGDTREPVQVIATTHSPYFLDLFKDHPDEIVIAEKDRNGAHFKKLSDHPDLENILNGAPLGEVWYSGVLGGVPTS